MYYHLLVNTNHNEDKYEPSTGLCYDGSYIVATEANNPDDIDGNGEFEVCALPSSCSDIAQTILNLQDYHAWLKFRLTSILARLIYDNLHLLYTTQDEMELVVLKKLAAWVLFKSLHLGYSPEDEAIRTREGIEDEIFIFDVLDYGEMTVKHKYVQEVADFTHKMYRTIARMRQDPHFSSRAIETLKRSGGFSRRALELERRGVAIVEE